MAPATRAGAADQKGNYTGRRTDRCDSPPPRVSERRAGNTPLSAGGVAGWCGGKVLHPKKKWLLMPFLATYCVISNITAMRGAWVENDVAAALTMDLPTTSSSRNEMGSKPNASLARRVVLVMANERKCRETAHGKKLKFPVCAFNNFGDTLMYLTAMQQCARLKLECRLYEDKYKNGASQALTSVVKNFQPNAFWWILGYAFSAKIDVGDKKMKGALDIINTLKKHNIKNYLFPQAVGPFNPMDKIIVANLFASFDSMAVRDADSANYIKESAHVDVSILQDTVFSKNLSRYDATSDDIIANLPDSRPKIGLSLSRKMKAEMDQGGKFDATVVHLLSTLSKNSTIVLIPHEQGSKKSKSDDRLVQHYYNFSMNALDIPPSNIMMWNDGSSNVERLEHVISRLDVLVVMRYHTMVVATREGVPTVTYSWASKYSDLLEQSGIGEEGLLSFDDNTRAIRQIWTVYDKRKTLGPKMRERSLQFRKQIDAMFEFAAWGASSITIDRTPCGLLPSHNSFGPLQSSHTRCTSQLEFVPAFNVSSRLELHSWENPPTKRMIEEGTFNKIKEYDRKRFAKHIADEAKPLGQLSHDNLAALILKYQHQLEKGLAMPNRRTQFGVKSGVYKKLYKFSEEFLRRYGKSSEFVFSGLGSAIDQYIDFHQSRGEQVDQVVLETRNLLESKGVSWKVNDGGIIEVNKESLIELGKGSFSSLVQARRSVRQYAPRLEDGSDELSKLRVDVYDAVRMAAEGTPSVCNRQGVKVALIRDKHKIDKAINIQGGGKGHSDPEYLVMVMSNLQIFREERERNQAYVDGGLFAMSLLYGLQSKGIATCSLNFSATMEKDKSMRKLMDIPDSHVIIMFIAVGRYLDEVVLTVSPRRASEDLSWIVREIP